MALSQGNQILANDFNNLFARLEEVRKKHYAASGLSSAQQQALSSTINTNVASQGVQAVPSNMQTLKNTLRTLSNSPYIAETFANNVTIPSVGDLLRYDTIAAAETQVSNVESLCAHCSAHFSSHFSSNFSSNFGAHFGSDFGRNFGSYFTTIFGRFKCSKLFI